MSEPMKYLPLFPESNLFCEAWSHTDDHRFVEVFQRVWRQIPERCRRELVKYWREKSAEYGERLPRIVVWRWHLHQNRDGGFWGIGQTGGIGTRMYFRSTWIDVMPDNIVGILIAHELGHAYLAAVNGPDYWFDSLTVLLEEDVAEALMWWDFDQEVLDEWIETHSHDFACIHCGVTVSAPVKSREWCRKCGKEYEIVMTAGVVVAVPK